MDTHAALHLVAIGFTVVAVCVHSGWRSRASSLSLVAAFLMLAGMVDVAFTSRLSIVVWIPALLATAMGLAAAQSVRRRRASAAARRGVWITAQDPLGLVATAALLPLMHVGSASESGHAGHGAPLGVLLAVVLLVAIGHAFGSFVACAASAALSVRVQHAAMGASTLLMAIAVVGARVV
ncbi:hypothetical protein LG299_12845 [Microbacterium lacus]|uniref:hypothetical protein n=1 Tax=Microbacterium lacus TaxID=415217 RepID=UPI00384A8F53